MCLELWSGANVTTEQVSEICVTKAADFCDTTQVTVTRPTKEEEQRMGC